MARLKFESTDCDLDITIAIICEALLHFILTISTLPSDRKVEIRYGLPIDVVIPNLLTLKRSPAKSIIVQIIKDVEDFIKFHSWNSCSHLVKISGYIQQTVFNDKIYRVRGIPKPSAG